MTTIGIIVAALLLLALPARAQLQLPGDGEPLRFSRLADVPRLLVHAVGRDRCQMLDSILRETPVVIFQPSPQHRAMAIVPCNGIVWYSLAFLYDRAMEQPPVPMHFPVAGGSEGFSATDSPGQMTWTPAAKTITALTVSDVCNVPERRHTYRHGTGDLNGFALVKVEQRRLSCEMQQEPWRVLWEAQAWPKAE
jgi:hypothetical protein